MGSPPVVLLAIDSMPACVVGVLPQSLPNFQGDLIRDLIAAGYAVTGMAELAGIDEVIGIEALGCAFKPYPVRRNRVDPVSDLITFLALFRAFRAIRPVLVVAYTIKPVIWGGLALRFVPGVRFVAQITGLGYAFQPGGRSRHLHGHSVCHLVLSGD